MGAIQEIVKAFYERKRLEDIYLVGIRGFMINMNQYTKLERRRYKGRVIESGAIESARKRCDISKKFARQYCEFEEIFDCEFDNYRVRYLKDPDLDEQATNVCFSAQCASLNRGEKQIRNLMEFISCNLDELEPVREDEIGNAYIGPI